MLLVIVIRRRRMRKLQENCPIPYFIELGPPTHAVDKADHQLVPTNADDTLSYPSSPVKTHPVMELYQHHARQYQMYQNMQVTSESSGRSTSSSSSDNNSDKQSDRESPWQRQYQHHHQHASDNNSDSQTSSLSSNSSQNHLRQSRRRRESFV